MYIPKIAKALILLSIAICIVSFNIIPIIYAKLSTPVNMIFSGQASWFDPWDINLYVSVIHSGQIRGFLLPNLYTTIPNPPILIYPFYTMLGIIFKQINPFLLFHSTAAIVGVVLVTSLFFLLKDFLPNTKERFMALIGICLGGGLGFLFYPTLQSADSAMTAFTFTSAFQRPHEALGILFYIISIVFFYKYINHINRKHYAVITLTFSSLLFLFFYPYYAVSFFVIMATYMFIKNRGELALSTYTLLFYLLILSLIIIMFLSQQFWANNTFKDVFAPKLPTLNLFFIFLGFGILVPLFVYQLLRIKKNQSSFFLNLWVIVGFLLALTPFDISRFYLRGLFFPIVILGIISIKNISQKLYIKPSILLVIFIGILALSQFKITYKRIVEVLNNNPWYYIHISQLQGFEFLNKYSPKDSGILALYKMGNIIPVYTHNSVYFGHYFQTPDSWEKLQNAYAFYANKLSEKEANQFLIKNHILYVMWGKEEQETTKMYSPKNTSLKYSFLIPVFKRPNLIIFQKKTSL